MDCNIFLLSLRRAATAFRTFQILSKQLSSVIILPAADHIFKIHSDIHFTTSQKEGSRINA